MKLVEARWRGVLGSCAMLLLACWVQGLYAQVAANTRHHLPDPTYADDAANTQFDPIDARIGNLVFPVLGFPALVQAGDELRVEIRLDDGGVTSRWSLALELSGAARRRSSSLPVLTVNYDAAGVYRLRAQVPAGTPRSVYDLVVTSPGLPHQSERQRLAVRVLEAYRDDFDFVHIADSQTQDPRTTDPTVVRRVLDEIRFRDPDFVVFGGDWNYGDDYYSEYRENYQLWVDEGVPVFMVPGNHDGYVTLSATPADVVRDGLSYWRKTCGPLYYSFDYGDRLHFVAVNSYDGEPQRRNAGSFIPLNYGGQVDAPQLAWLDSDLAAATAGGRSSVLFMHHDPRGPYTPNRQAYPYSYLAVAGNGNQQWNDSANGKAIRALTEQYPITHVLMGHDHADRHGEELVHAGLPDERKLHWVHTTTMAVDLPANQLGYRLIQVRGGKIAELFHGGPAQQSVPVPPGRNDLTVVHLDANDGSAPAAEALVTNMGKTAVQGVLRFFVQPAAQGLSLRGGQLRNTFLADDGTAILDVLVLVPSGSSAGVRVEPASSPGGVQVALPPAQLASSATADADQTPAPAARRSDANATPWSRGGCATGISQPPPTGLWPWCLLLWIALKRRGDRRSRFSGAVLLLLLFQASAPAAEERRYVPGEILVKLPGLQEQEVLRLIGPLGGRILDRPGPRGLVLTLPDLYRIGLPGGASLPEALQRLRARPEVAYALPNYYVRLRLAQARTSTWAAPAGLGGQNTPSAPGLRQVVVAVIDTGVNVYLEPFRGHVWENALEVNGQAHVDDDGNGFVDDLRGYNFGNDSNTVQPHPELRTLDPQRLRTLSHGTGVASIVIGANHPGDRPSEGLQVMSLNMMGPGMDNTLEAILSDIASAIRYATDNGADVINMSMATSEDYPPLREAIEYAGRYGRGGKGTLVIASAGNIHPDENEARNLDETPEYPVAYRLDNLISVAAANSQGITAGSNYGQQTVDVATDHEDFTVLTLDGSYRQGARGTSLNTPEVTNLVARLIQKYPQATAAEIRQHIIDHALPRDGLKDKIRSGGLVGEDLLDHPLKSAAGMPRPPAKGILGKLREASEKSGR